jgi:SAM-dependent methyltransferase
MHIKELQKNWDEFGRTDPLWAIITDPTKKGSRWDVGEFFQTGRDEIAAVLHYAGSLGIRLRRRRALDFGCGVGRLTQAMAEHFDEADGVDIAPSMIELARQYNRHGERCRYLLNERSDLRLFEANRFDFIYTNVVLQHMEPRYAVSYLKEFLRVLAPGGLILFQLPSHAIARPLVRDRVKRAIKWLLPRSVLRAYHRLRGTHPAPEPLGPVMEMYGMSRPQVERLLRRMGAQLLDVIPDESPGPTWISYRYCVTKQTAA